MANCVICGNPLPPNRKKYCSEACAKEAERRLSRAPFEGRERPKPYHTIICPDCGQEAYVHIKSKRCKACQKEADRLHDLECKARKRAGKVRSIGSIDLCQRCGKPYEVEGGMQRYCKECAPIAAQENDRAASIAWNRAHYDTPEKREALNAGKRRPKAEDRTCPECGKTFSPRSIRDVYCSRACYAQAAKRQSAEYEQAHKDERRADHKRDHERRLAAMTPEERRAWQDARNAIARANYAKLEGTAFDPGDMLTLKAYAQTFGLKYVTVSSQCKNGRLIGAAKIGKYWYVSPRAVIGRAPVETAVCPHCGKEFEQTGKGPDAVYCSKACWTAAHADELKTYQKQWYQEHRAEKLAYQAAKHPRKRKPLTDEEKKEKQRAYQRAYYLRRKAARNQTVLTPPEKDN